MTSQQCRRGSLSSDLLLNTFSAQRPGLDGAQYEEPY